MRKTEQVKKYLVIGGGIVIGLGLMVAICMQFGKSSEEKDSPKQNPSVTTKMVVNPDESTTESSHVEEPRESTTESSFAEEPRESTTESSHVEEPRESTTESLLVEEPRENTTESSHVEELRESTTESSHVEELRESTTESRRVVKPRESTTESSLAEEPRESTTESSPAVKPKEKSSSTNTKKKQPVDRRVEQTNQIQQKIQPDVTKPKSPSKKALTDPNKKPDGTKVDTPPEPVEHKRVEKTKEVPTQSKEPQGGDTKDGKVYLPGFGWVTDTGGSGTDANDMYENGNKIGSMD